MPARYRPATERFWEKVRKESGDGCWVWQAGCTYGGYGVFWHNGRSIAAHVFAWLEEGNTIPDGEELMHAVCDNPPCVRTSHLKSAPHAVNSADMAAKGRGSGGHSRLTPEQRLQIVQRYRPGVRGFGLPALAKEYGVTIQAIAYIIRKSAPP